MRKMDLSGQRFGKWSCLWPAPSTRRMAWVVQCDCGTVRVVTSTSLRQGRSTTCGCGRLTHRAGLSNDVYKATRREYCSWQNMLDRCYNPKSANWKYYGAKGRKVCDRWRGSFTDFLADMGRPPNTTLDRKDTTGNYEPENCRWATQAEQIANRVIYQRQGRPRKHL